MAGPTTRKVEVEVENHVINVNLLRIRVKGKRERFVNNGDFKVGARVKTKVQGRRLA